MTGIRPLKSEADYDAALAEIEQYFNNEPEPGTLGADRFDLLALVIGDYEAKHWGIEERRLTAEDLELLARSEPPAGAEAFNSEYTKA